MAISVALLALVAASSCLSGVACRGDQQRDRPREGLVSTGLSGARQGGANLEAAPELPRPRQDGSAQQQATQPPQEPAPTSTDGGRSRPPRRPDFSDHIAEAAAEILGTSDARHWTLAGSLGPEDLTIRLRTQITNRQGEVMGEAGFNLSAVLGFRGVPKCNLLAFEIAFRAGFVVPLVGRTVGWGFPSSEMLANDALDNRIRGEWALVRERPIAANVNLDRELGTAFLVVARAATYGRPGHVAIIDWVEDLVLTRDGDIRVLSFMGWEANTTEGARYRRITFATTDAVPYSRFDHVFILELRAAEPGNEVAMIGRGPRNPTHAINLEGSSEGERPEDDERTQEQ